MGLQQLKTHLLKTGLTLAGCLILAGAINVGKAEATPSPSQWQAGNIISDGKFFNSTSMTPAAIQNFLNSKVAACDTWGTQPYGNTGMTRAQWAAANGKPQPPYTCLKEYSENTPAMSADAYCNAYGGGTNNAATIIWYISQICGINPQVLIVLLQKEQSLVTDDWPWPRQYQFATGYCVYDVGPPPPSCEGTDGFFRQVYYAARQFKRYAALPQNYNFRPNATSNIQYDVDTNCGSSAVYIQNQATANLYNYTPYQPNQAALNAGYGSAEPCGAYGNRNFWLFYWDWFGPTTGVDYSWSYISTSFSTGSSQVTGNSQITITVTAKNTGNQSWSSTNFPVRLATFAPSNHSSALYNSSWISSSRPANVGQPVVAPGENGTFTFVANVPNISGSYYERFNLVAEGSTWMPDIGFSIELRVTKSTYKYQMVSQSSTNGWVLTPGQNSQFTLVARNTGNTTWNNSSNPVKLATWDPPYSRSDFDPGTWEGPYRAATLQESSVAPGQNGTFVFPVKAPNTSGFYAERFNLVMEGVSWFDDPWLEFQTNVGNFYTWQMVSQSSNQGFSLSKGEIAQFTLVAKNTGNVTWNNSSNPVRLATWNPSYRISPFCSDNTNWVMGCIRAATLQQSSVAPGNNGTFVFTVQAPQKAGFYLERFNLVAEGLAWFTDPWLEFQVHVE
ncbi:MAG: hypothetical protein WD877_00490 [Candidatus Saccharimonadales bacterium]